MMSRKILENPGRNGSLRNRILEAVEKELKGKIIIIISHVKLENKENRISVEVAEKTIRALNFRTE